jgi:V/A-type H+-transporting ATPase subunit C
LSRIKDTDYLHLSARLHALETKLLTRERMERMIDAKDHADAVKILSECGYGELSELSLAALESTLATAQDTLFRELGSAVPDPNLIDVFRIKYDYHNAKVLVKSGAADVKPLSLLMGGGRYEPVALMEAFQKEDLRSCSSAFAAAANKAAGALAETGDPQQCDLILDRACYEELVKAAAATGSNFVLGYVRILIDAVNLRTAVRAARLGKEPDFLSAVLLPGGNVAADTLARTKADDLPRLFSFGPLSEAAALGAALAAPRSGSLTAFERACDNGVTAYVSAARRIPFGEQTVVGYLYARENEMTAIRIIMSGRLAGLSGDTIRERLRDSYV